MKWNLGDGEGEQEYGGFCNEFWSKVFEGEQKELRNSGGGG